MLKMLIVLLLLVMGSTSAIGQDADELRKAYLTQVLKLDITQSEDRAAAQITLKQFAKRFIAQLKAQGDVNGYLLAEQDFKALDLEKPPTQAQHPQVRKLLVAYREELAKAEAKHARNFSALNRHYAAKLKELIKSLMAENKIAEARSVQDEMDAIGKLGANPPGKTMPRTSPSPARYTAWEIETVDSKGNVGPLWPSLRHGPSGRPAISYTDETNSDLKYAFFTGTRWVTTTVDSKGDVGVRTSLSHGPSGRPAISYRDSTNEDLKYAVFNGTSWVATIVDSKGDVGNYTSLSHGPSGHPAISYRDSTNDNLKYAVFNGTRWVTTTVGSKGNVGYYTSLGHGPSGLPAISYRDSTNQDLKFATFDGARWVTTTVDSKGDVGLYTSLSHGPSGRPAISYYDNTNHTKGDLKYAAFDGTSWAITTVDSKGNVGKYTSLSHGPSGHPAISYRDSANQDLQYAVFDGAKWQIETVDSKGDVGKHTSLSHGPDGEVVISYYDVTNKDLKIATKARASRTRLRPSVNPPRKPNAAAIAKFNKGLVAYYPFNGNANDESGNGNDGKVNGARLTADRNGKANSASRFDGGSWIDVGHVIEDYANCTFSAWIKAEDRASSAAIVSAPRGAAGTGFRLGMRSLKPNVGFQGPWRIPNRQGNASGGLLSKDQSYFVAGTVGQNVVRIYVDGVLEGSDTFRKRSTVQTAESVYIGREFRESAGSTGQRHFTGTIDDVRIYNRTLSEAEVKELYAFEKAK